MPKEIQECKKIEERVSHLAPQIYTTIQYNCDWSPAGLNFSRFLTCTAWKQELRPSIAEQTTKHPFIFSLYCHQLSSDTFTLWTIQCTIPIHMSLGCTSKPEHPMETHSITRRMWKHPAGNNADQDWTWIDVAERWQLYYQRYYDIPSLR